MDAFISIKHTGSSPVVKNRFKSDIILTVQFEHNDHRLTEKQTRHDIIRSLWTLPLSSKRIFKQTVDVSFQNSSLTVCLLKQLFKSDIDAIAYQAGFLSSDCEKTFRTKQRHGSSIWTRSPKFGRRKYSEGLNNLEIVLKWTGCTSFSLTKTVLCQTLGASFELNNRRVVWL